MMNEWDTFSDIKVLIYPAIKEHVLARMVLKYTDLVNIKSNGNFFASVSLMDRYI